jgi:tryptophan synthase alpha chain
MSNKIDERLALLKKQQRPGLMTHTVVGYPSLQATIEIVQDMSDSGVDFVELQIPFSDPIADGPTIQHACEEALAQGIRVKDAFVAATALSKTTKMPLLFMTYYNIVHAYGVEQFCADVPKPVFLE